MKSYCRDVANKPIIIIIIIIIIQVHQKEMIR